MIEEENKNAGTTFRLRLKYSDHLLVGALLKQLTTGTCRTRRQIKPITDARWTEDTKEEMVAT